MIVKRVRIERFRRFRDFEAELGPGLVVVTGPNESGKSTLVDALVAAFYVKPSTSSRERESMNSWGLEIGPRVTVWLDIDGVEAVVEKDFENKKARIEADGEVITTLKKVEEWLFERLGFASADLFTSTACVREEGIAIPRVSGASAVSRQIMEELQEMLTGGPGGSPAQIKARIKKSLAAIECAPTATRSAGRVPEIESRLLAARDQLSVMRNKRSKYYSTTREIEAKKTSLELIESKRADIDAALMKHRQYKEAMELAVQISHDLDRLMRASEVLAELDMTTERLNSFIGYEKLDEAALRLSSLSSREDARLKLEEKRRRLYQETVKPGAVWIGLVVAGVVALLAGGGIFAHLREWWPMAAGSGLAAILGSLGLALLARSRKRERERRSMLESSIADDELRLANDDREAASLCGLFGKKNEDECLKSFRVWQALARERDRLSSHFRDLAGDITSESLEARKRKLAAERLGAEEHARCLSDYRIEDTSKLAQFERLASELLSEQKKMEHCLLTLMAEIKAAEFDADELSRFEEEEAELADRLVYWQGRAEVHKRALAVLEDAITKVMARAGEVIESELAPRMSEITEGLYGRVRVDTDLSLAVYDAKKDRWVEEADLSLAAREQLQVSARFALVKLLTEGRHPPIILDDPFAHFDPQRFANIMRVVRRMSRERQVIVLAPTDRYHEFADRVIDIEKFANARPQPGNAK